MATTQRLTKSQHRFLDAVRAYRGRKGRLPTIRELAKILARSSDTLLNTARTLVAAGYKRESLYRRDDPTPLRLRPLTDPQSKILDYVIETIDATGRAPSIREIADQFGYASPNGVAQHLRTLETKGELKLEAGTPRGIRVLRRPDGTPV